MLLALLTYLCRIESLHQDKMNWQPQQEPLRQLARYLRDSLNGANLPARAEAEQVMSFPFFFQSYPIELPLDCGRRTYITPKWKLTFDFC